MCIRDRPNANLDANGDAALTAAIAGCRERQKTVIVMTHRPSAIAAVDMILMLNAGQVEHFGPKQEVLAALQQKNKERQQSQSGNSASKQRVET